MSLLWSLPCAAAAVWLLRAGRGTNYTAHCILAVFLLSSPFLWTLVTLLRTADADDRADQLLSLWPHILVLSAVVTILDLRKPAANRCLLPWVLLATIHGAFLSQQLWGSTYAFWPLLVLLIAGLLIRVPGIALPLGAVVSTTLFVSGAAYAVCHERLSYIHTDGPPAYASVPALRGMRSPGPWIPGFEELIHFADAEVPQDEGILLVPGEGSLLLRDGPHTAFPCTAV